MFNKTQPAPQPRNTPPQAAPQAAAPQAAAPAPRPAGVSSVIGKDVHIVGDISGEGELQIDGVVKGQVRAGRLIVGEGGHVEGEIRAQVAEVRGRVQGTITARQVRLYGTANVDGDITHEQLAMETGAFFQGRSVKYTRPAEGAAPQAAPASHSPSPLAPAGYSPAAPSASAPSASAPSASAPAPFSGPAPAAPYPA